MASLTRIFDGLYVDQLFHKNDQGQTVYYPFGLAGRGYLLPAEREASVRRATRWLTASALAVVIGFAFVANLAFASISDQVPLAVAAVLALCAVSLLVQSRLTAGLEPVPGPRQSLGEWFRRGRAARATWTYWVSIALGLLMLPLAAGGFVIGFLDRDITGFLAGGLFLLFALPLIWDGALGLLERSRATKAP